MLVLSVKLNRPSKTVMHLYRCFMAEFDAMEHVVGEPFLAILIKR